MTTSEWPWTRLPRHEALIDRLREVVVGSDAWRWLEVCCSLAAGRGDELGVQVATPWAASARARLDAVDAP